MCCVHIEIDGAATLKRASEASGVLRCSQREITSPSRATVTVPAEAPNRMTDVKTKVSDTERVAGMDGTCDGDRAAQQGQTRRE